MANYHTLAQMKSVAPHVATIRAFVCRRQVVWAQPMLLSIACQNKDASSVRNLRMFSSHLTRRTDFCLCRSTTTVHMTSNAAFRSFSFSFPTPKSLADIFKIPTDQLPQDPTELTRIWTEYHENKEDRVGTVVNGEKGNVMLERSAEW
mmetsp:Transcript_28363/g.64877  ORF Transcript_28363/g.64877 Transcript_28363/m.64877 type:complete len:148 (-) Transcript_28363:613-1056(-)